MSGRHGGVQALMRNQFPNAHFVHCYAHQLTLIMQQACNKKTRPIKIFFTNLSFKFLVFPHRGPPLSQNHAIVDYQEQVICTGISTDGPSGAAIRAGID